MRIFPYIHLNKHTHTLNLQLKQLLYRKHTRTYVHTYQLNSLYLNPSIYLAAPGVNIYLVSGILIAVSGLMFSIA